MYIKIIHDDQGLLSDASKDKPNIARGSPSFIEIHIYPGLGCSYIYTYIQVEHFTEHHQSCIQ
jgi:hypothetical protein